MHFARQAGAFIDDGAGLEVLLERGLRLLVVAPRDVDDGRNDDQVQPCIPRHLIKESAGAPARSQPLRYPEGRRATATKMFENTSAITVV